MNDKKLTWKERQLPADDAPLDDWKACATRLRSALFHAESEYGHLLNKSRRLFHNFNRLRKELQRARAIIGQIALEERVFDTVGKLPFE